MLKDENQMLPGSSNTIYLHTSLLTQKDGQIISKSCSENEISK